LIIIIVNIIYYLTITLSMNSTTEEKIVRLLAQLAEMQVMEQNARAVQDENRLAQAEKFVSLVKNQLLKLKPDIVFPEFPAW
jgi:hypothetical protein